VVSGVVDVPFPTEPPAVPLGYPADAPAVWIGSLGIVDPWKVVLPLTVTVGRSDPGVQPEAGAATIRLLDITSVRRDEQVQIWHGDKLRFTGRVTTIKAVQTGGRTITEVACLGNLARLAQINLTPIERDEGTEQERVASILAQLPPLAPIDPIQTVWGDQHSPFRFRREFVENTDPRPVVELLHEVAANTGAILWEKPNGKITYEALVAREGTQRSATVSAYQIDDGVGWEKTAAQPPRTVQVWYGPKPEDPVKPPERPGSLTGIDLDTIQVGGWWVGAPGANGPPWLPAGREIWLSSAADPVTGVAWQLATTQAAGAADPQVWMRQRVGGSWTAWRWQSGGLPAYKSATFELNLGPIGAGVNWPSVGNIAYYTPVPVRLNVRLHVAHVSLHHATMIGVVHVGIIGGAAAGTLSFSTQKGFDAGHTVARHTIPAGTSRISMWINAPSGMSFVGRPPEVSIGIEPVGIAHPDEMALLSEDPWVPPPDAPPLYHQGQWPPEPPAPAPPVDAPGGP
jgi:hypothetical protein